jgi:hypothetical protein
MNYYIPLGQPGYRLAAPVEDPYFWLEQEPGHGVFEFVPWAGQGFTIRIGANGIPTCEFDVTLGDEGMFWPTAPAEELSDWLVRGPGGTADRPEEAILGGRRIQIRTSRGYGGDDWVLFDGYVLKLRLGFSGASTGQPRWLKGIAISSFCAADLEPTQQLSGQWRRTRECEVGLIKGTWEDAPHRCCRTPVPLIFNPDGEPNCDPLPLVLSDDPKSKVYIPCDPDRKTADYWTFARILRYIEWCGFQPAAPDPGNTEAQYYDVECLSRPQGFTALVGQWTSIGLRHANLDQLLASPWDSKTVVECTADSATTQLGLRSLLRAPRSLSVQGMSVAEAFIHVCQRAGIILDIFHQIGGGGAAQTFIKFSVRGHTFDPGGALPMPLPQSQQSKPAYMQ